MDNTDMLKKIVDIAEKIYEGTELGISASVKEAIKRCKK